MIRRDIIIIPQKLCFPPVSAHMPLEWVMKHQRPNSVSAFKCMFILPFGRLGSGNDLVQLYLNHLALILIVHNVPQSGSHGRSLPIGRRAC